MHTEGYLQQSGAGWDWRASEAHRAAEPARQVFLRRRGSIIQASMMTAAGLLFALVWSKAHPAAILFILAGLSVVGGWMLPPLYRVIETVLAWAIHGFSNLLAWLLLAPFFYICFTIGRLGWRWRGSDRLQLRFPGGASSYWHTWAGRNDSGQYRKQY